MAYFYDAEAVKKSVTGNAHARGDGVNPKPKAASGVYRVRENDSFSRAVRELVSERNARTVWSIPTKPFKDAHFATFPPELAARCIRAGTSERGACASCGAPWERVLERQAYGDWNGQQKEFLKIGHQSAPPFKGYVPPKTVGWRASCACDDAGEPVPCVVLDPFAGSFTTCEVAARMGRAWIGIELNPEYVKMGRRRLAPYMRGRCTRSRRATKLCPEPEGNSGADDRGERGQGCEDGDAPKVEWRRDASEPRDESVGSPQGDGGGAERRAEDDLVHATGNHSGRRKRVGVGGAR